jgi:23S rRNA pseudouridine1911/1915/1917 synthase
VFATRVKAARRLARQFENRTVKKTYWAFVQGDVQPQAGAWRDHLRKVPEVARAEIVAATETGARQAVLHYEVCWRNPQGSLLRIELETGRMHQIRLQAASRGHPIWGDRQYGSPFAFGPREEDYRLRWIALHAQRIEFEHTVSRQSVSVTAPLPDIWASLGVPRLDT